MMGDLSVAVIRSVRVGPVAPLGPLEEVNG